MTKADIDRHLKALMMDLLSRTATENRRLRGNEVTVYNICGALRQVIAQQAD